MWPSIAMQFRTTEPIAVAGAARRGRARCWRPALGAMAIALAAGVGAWAARTAPNAPLAGPLPPWAAGVAAALFVAGAGALAGRLVPPEAPLWPSLALESAAFPWAAAALEGLAVVSSIGVGLFLLHILDRVTAAWTRRSWFALAIVVALITGIIAAKAGEAGAALAEGIGAGLFAAAVVYFVLRFDARTVPGLPGDGRRCSTRRKTPRSQGTRAGWVAFAIARRGQRRRRYRGDALHRPAVARRAAGSRRGPLLDRDPVGDDVVVGAVHRGDVAARRPRDHLPVQRDVVGLGVVREQRLVDHLAGAPRRSCRS